MKRTRNEPPTKSHWPSGRNWWLAGVVLLLLVPLAVGFDTRGAFLSLPFGLLLSRSFFDFISRAVFNRKFSPPNSGGDGNAHCQWSDWLLLLPFASGAVVVVFLVGEVGDWIRKENSWPLW